MATITEDYVSFETAKLLKEKRFDSNCFYIWFKTDKNEIPSLLATANFVEGEMTTNRETLDIVTQYHINIYGLNNRIESFLCPTLQTAMKWLREVHGLFISIGNDDLDYNWQIFDIKNRTKDLDPTCLTESYAGYREYKQVCEAAIKYCLENLI